MRWIFLARTSRGERGASAVEFAIIAPLFFMLTFGAITGALMYTQNSEITHAAREGARYGATVPQAQTFSGCSLGNQPACWADHVRTYTIARAFGNLDNGVAGRRVCVALVTGNPATVVTSGGNPYRSNPDSPALPLTPDGACYNDTTGVTGDPGMRVQIVAQRRGQLNAVLVQMNPTLTSRATAQYEDVG